jgi:hypothetical protein
MMNRLVIACMCASLVVAGCAKNQQATGPAGNQSPGALANTTDLPLYEGAVVIDARQFQQIVDPSKDKASPFANLSKGTYAGKEVVASSPATVAELDAWLEQQGAAPPSGYRKQNVPASVQATTHKYGIDFVAFVNGNNKGATIVVMDPKLVTSKLGGVLKVLEQYNSLPAPLKQGMDSQVKQRTGWSISELTDKSAPLGAAIAAMNDFKNSDKRAIILVSAEKAQ